MCTGRRTVDFRHCFGPLLDYQNYVAQLIYLSYLLMFLISQGAISLSMITDLWPPVKTCLTSNGFPECHQTTTRPFFYSRPSHASSTTSSSIVLAQNHFCPPLLVFPIVRSAAGHVLVAIHVAPNSDALSTGGALFHGRISLVSLVFRSSG